MYSLIARELRRSRPRGKQSLPRTGARFPEANSTHNHDVANLVCRYSRPGGRENFVRAVQPNTPTVFPRVTASETGAERGTRGAGRGRRRKFALFGKHEVSVMGKFAVMYEGSSGKRGAEFDPEQLRGCFNISLEEKEWRRWKNGVAAGRGGGEEGVAGA